MGKFIVLEETVKELFEKAEDSAVLFGYKTKKSDVFFYYHIGNLPFDAVAEESEYFVVPVLTYRYISDIVTSEIVQNIYNACLNNPCFEIFAVKTRGIVTKIDRQIGKETEELVNHLSFYKVEYSKIGIKIHLINEYVITNEEELRKIYCDSWKDMSSEIEELKTEINEKYHPLVSHL